MPKQAFSGVGRGGGGGEAEEAFSGPADVSCCTTQSIGLRRSRIGARTRRCLVTHFLRNGHDRNGDRQDLGQCLMAAIRQEDAGLARLLLEAKAPPNVRGEFGWTPVHVAIHSHQNRVLEMLKEQNADCRMVLQVPLITPHCALSFTAWCRMRPVVKQPFCGRQLCNSPTKRPSQMAQNSPILRGEGDYTELLQFKLCTNIL